MLILDGCSSLMGIVSWLFAADGCDVVDDLIAEN
jgi:hypothetical protein